jgi:hypothetical protein
MESGDAVARKPVRPARGLPTMWHLECCAMLGVNSV